MNQDEGSGNRDAGGRLTRVRTRRGVLIKRLPRRHRREIVYAKHWTLTKRWLGKLYYFTLPAERKEAESLANEIDRFLDVRSHTIEEAIEKFAPEKLRREQARELKKVATVGELLEAHRQCEKLLELSPPTAREYRRALASMVRRVKAFRLGKPVGVKNVPWHRQSEITETSVSDLDARFVLDFKKAMLVAARTESEIQTRKRTTNSVIRCASPVLAPEAVAKYGLNLPDFSSFFSEKSWRRVHSTKYRLPEQSVIRRLFTDAHELKKNDPNAYLAFLLAVTAGLRAKEIAYAQRQWFDDQNRIWITHADDFSSKSGKERMVEMEHWAVEEILAVSQSPGFLLSGPESERRSGVLRRLNPWLKERGLDRSKPTHELRRLFGSYIATTRGVFIAQKFLGHSTPQLTSDQYADALLSESLLRHWRERIAA